MLYWCPYLSIVLIATSIEHKLRPCREEDPDNYQPQHERVNIDLLHRPINNVDWPILAGSRHRDIIKWLGQVSGNIEETFSPRKALDSISIRRIRQLPLLARVSITATV